MTARAEDIEHIVHSWITDASGLDGKRVAWGYSKAGDPETPFLRLTMITGLVHDYESASIIAPAAGANSDEWKVRVPGHFELEIQGFGTGCRDILTAVDESFDDPYISAALILNQRSVVTVGEDATGAYEITVGGEVVSFDATGGESIEDIRDALVVALNEDPYVPVLADSIDSTGGQLDLVGRNGLEFTVSVSENLTVETTDRAVHVVFQSRTSGPSRIPEYRDGMPLERVVMEVRFGTLVEVTKNGTIESVEIKSLLTGQTDRVSIADGIEYAIEED